jgi:hypothetical protein
MMPPSSSSTRRWSPRSFGPKPLADLVAPTLDPVLARQGFSEADLLLHWPDIVGSELAAHCAPLKLEWRRRRASEHRDATPPAVLIVRTEGAFALQLQHMASVVVERVNTHLGWACVGKLALRQGPLPQPAVSRRVRLVPDAAAQREAGRSTAGVADDNLRNALTRLGASVLSRRRAASARGEK